MNKFYKIISIILIISILMSIPVFGVGSFFLDVDKDNPYYDAVQYCYEQNYINGTGNNNFSPDRNITLTEFLSINLAAFYPEEYKNIDFNDWHNSVNDTCIKLNLITEWETKNSQNNYSWIKILEIVFKSNSLTPYSPLVWNVSFELPGYSMPEINLIISAKQYGFLNNLNISNYKTIPTRAEITQLIYNIKKLNSFQVPVIVENFPVKFDEQISNFDKNIFYEALSYLPQIYLDDFVSNNWSFYISSENLSTFYNNNSRYLSAIGVTDPSRKIIYIKAPLLFSGPKNILHEFGHFISYNYNIFLPLDIFEKEKSQLSQFIRSYAATNIDEAFAELYAFYMTYNSNEQIMNDFKNTLPLCYDFISENIILQ